jgi:hypothetical protein
MMFADNRNIIVVGSHTAVSEIAPDAEGAAHNFASVFFAWSCAQRLVRQQQPRCDLPSFRLFHAPESVLHGF